jgi:uncharacterized protein (TIGR03083 family)
VFGEPLNGKAASMTREDLLAALQTNAADLAAYTETADLGTPVPTCPGWTLRDLVNHTGGIHRWAARVVETGDGNHDRSATGPDEPDALAVWLLDGAEQLHRTLATTDPDRSCWTFGFPPHQAGFWLRRQALETAVHRWDARNAVGRPVIVESGLAAAGIDEVVDFLYPRQVALGRTPQLTGGVQLTATDLSTIWYLGETDAAITVKISGPARNLLLLLWGRLPPDDRTVTTTGSDVDVAAVRSARFAP